MGEIRGRAHETDELHFDGPPLDMSKLADDQVIGYGARPVYWPAPEHRQRAPVCRCSLVPLDMDKVADGIRAAQPKVADAVRQIIAEMGEPPEY